MKDQTVITLAGIGVLGIMALIIRPTDPTALGAFIVAITGLAGYHISKQNGTAPAPPPAA